MKTKTQPKIYNVEITPYEFNSRAISNLKESEDHLWPTVYLIEDAQGKINEAYIGESTHIYSRIQSHLQNKERSKLNRIHLIQSKAFNKSATLDIESRLIKYMAADGLYKLQNGNAGLTVHNYYQQNKYEQAFEDIWRQLQEKKLVKNSLTQIYNSDLFKYSPYKSLTDDQFDSVIKITSWLKSGVKQPLFVIGGAGTGKTVLGTYLVKLFKSDLSAFEMDNLDDTYKEVLLSIKEIYAKNPDLQIGYVVPQKSLRKTLKNVFGYVKGLKPQMVISANDIVKKKYDLVFVDEAHRLRRRRNLPSGPQYTIFDNISKSLGLDPNTCDELDWIMKCSKHQVLFYDPSQTVRPTDILQERFSSLITAQNNIYLKSQLRVLGGNDYIKYVDSILSCTGPKPNFSWGKYEFKLVDSFPHFVNLIKELNKKHELCRLIAGYSWEWVSKPNPKRFDITIEGIKLRWNMTDVDWINTKTSVEEVGCIHTTQGYDLNYSGIIFGREIDYNPETGCIEVNKKLYFDSKGKDGIKDDHELKQFIINVYKTIMYRGIKGTYVYAVNKNLKDYLKRYIESI